MENTTNFVDTSILHANDGSAQAQIDNNIPQGEQQEIVRVPEPPKAIDAAIPADAEVIGGTAGEGFKSVFIDWAKENNFEFDEGSIGELASEKELRDLTAKTYAIEYAKNVDPFLANLLDKGISMEAYNESIAPIQEVLSQSNNDIYAYGKYEEEVEELARIGKINDSTPESFFDSLWEKHTKQTEEKFNGLTESEIEGLTKTTKDKYTAKMQELTTGWKEKESSSVAARQKAYEDNYSNELNALLGDLDSKFEKNQITGLVGTPEKEPFKKFLDEQLSIQSIKVTVEGKESEVRGIPFMHKLSTDNDYLLKVMAIIHQAENGKVADAVNQKVGEVIKPLRLTPLSKGAGVSAPSQGNSFFDTSKKH